MNASRTALNFYAECMMCPNTSDQCPGIWKDIPGGVPPRGFFFQQVPVQLLVVAKNPGHPMHGESCRLAARTGTELLEAYRQFQNELYPNPDAWHEPSNRFHKNLFRYLGCFLDVPQSEIYQLAAHTNLVKCSTEDEQAKLNPRTMETCFETYFLAELKIFRPKVLLALGREVERFLLSRRDVHGLPVVEIKHPSYYYRREAEKEILAKKREEIRSYF